MERVYLPIQNGQQLPLRVWRPKGRARSTVVALHGQITHSGWFERLGLQLIQMDIALVAADRRGNGEAKHLIAANGIRDYIDDIGLSIKFARSISSDVSLLCWCFGAKIGLPAALEFDVQRVVLPSPSLFSAKDMIERIKALTPINGFLPIHFDPITEFSDIPEVQEYIKRDHQLLDRIPVSQRELSKALGLIATDAVAKLKVPLLSILADNDKIIDLNKTVELLKHSPLKWFKGGHGFVLEPGGPEMIAFELDAFVEKS